VDIPGVLQNRINITGAPPCFRFVKVEDLVPHGSWSVHAITAVPCNGDLCPSEPEAFNCLCEIGACESASSSTPAHCQDIEVLYSTAGVQVHNGVGGSAWTLVSSTYGSGGSYLATASKAADRFIDVQSNLGSGYYSVYIRLPIPLRRKDLSKSVSYSFGGNTVWIEQRDKSSGGFLRLEVDGPGGAGDNEQTVFLLDPPVVRINTAGSSSGLVIADLLRFCRKTNGPVQAIVGAGDSSSIVSNPVAASGFVAVGVLAAIGVFALVRLVKKRRSESESNEGRTLSPAISTEAPQATESVEFDMASAAAPVPTRSQSLRELQQLYAALEPQGEAENSVSTST